MAPRLVPLDAAAERSSSGSSSSSSSSSSDDDNFNILDFAAVGDGRTINTVAIQSAIDAAFQHGEAQQRRGRVIVPSPGVFLTGSLVLKSGVELYIQSGATLLGSTDRSDYKYMSRWTAVLMAENASNIKITGEDKATSIIDGQGRQLALNIEELYHQGKIDDPNYSTRRRRTSGKQRPQIIEFINCHNVQVSNVQIRDAACWVQTYLHCTNLAIVNVIVESDAYWNNDGFDILDCKNVSIQNCDINSADDGICLKSYSPRANNTTTSAGSSAEEAEDSNDLLGVYNVDIIDCRIRSSASGIKFGTSSYVAFQKITIRNVLVYDTFRSALAIEAVDGAVIEDINVSDLVSRNTGNPLFLRLGQRTGSPGAIRRVRIKNIVADVPFGRPDERYDIRGPSPTFFHNPVPCSIAGMPECFIEDIHLQNIDISFPGRANRGLAYLPLSRLSDVPENTADYPEFTMFEELPCWSFFVRHAKKLRFENVRLRLSDGSDFRPAFVFDNVDCLGLCQMQLPVSGWSGPQFALRNAHDVDLDDIDPSLVTWIDS